MNEPVLQDLIRRGLGRAAMIAGAWAGAYRPHGPHEPVAAERRFLRLNAAFTAAGGPRVPPGYGQAAWHGLFDAAYTRPGDFLVRTGEDGREPEIWFIASQLPLAPPLCIRATRIACFSRAAAPQRPGINGYGGLVRAAAVSLATGWPVSVLAAGGAGMDAAALPADAVPGAWSVLLPRVDGVVFRPGDLMTDDLARTAVVAAAELTDLGWRLLARQVST